MSFLLFIINPFVGFLRTLKDLRVKSSAMVFILFYALFGFAISFNLVSADSYRVGAGFCSYQTNLSETFLLYIEGRIPDLYRFAMYAILREFTSNPKFLFAVFGLVLGIFSYLTIRFFYKEFSQKGDSYFFIIVLCLLCLLSFFNVNGARFNTATPIFTFFAIQALFYNRKVFYAGILITPLVHFSYYIALIGILLFFLLDAVWKDKPQFFFLLMIISFFSSFVVPNAVASEFLESEELELENTSINKKVENYSAINKGGAESVSVQQGTYRAVNALYTNSSGWFRKIGVLFILSLIFSKRKVLLMDARDLKLLRFTMLMFAMSDLGSLFSSTISRFHTIVCILFLFLLLRIYTNNRKVDYIKKYILWLLPLFLYWMLFNIINIPRLVSPSFWYLPSVATIIDGWNFGPIYFI